MPADSYGPIQGEHGTAVPVAVPKVPDLAPLIIHWLITAPGYNPARGQWVISATTTTEIPGFKPVRLEFAGATHEVVIMPVDPAGGEQTPHSLIRLVLARELPLIRADAVRFQVRASEMEIRELIPVLAGAVVRQGWSPDLSMARDPGQMRGAWRESAEANLAAIRSDSYPQLAAAGLPLPVTGIMTPPGGHRTP